jgi:hypothetical protein
MKPRVVDGWLVVPCDAPDLATVHIGWGKNKPGQWTPGFRDWRDGARVAQTRNVPPPGVWRVWVRVNGTDVATHRLTV